MYYILCIINVMLYFICINVADTQSQITQIHKIFRTETNSMCA